MLIKMKRLTRHRRFKEMRNLNSVPRRPVLSSRLTYGLDHLRRVSSRGILYYWRILKWVVLPRFLQNAVQTSFLHSFLNG